MTFRHDNVNNVNNLTCDAPVVANTKHIARTATQMCLGNKLDENLYWHSHIKMKCKMVSAGIGVNPIICL